MEGLSCRASWREDGKVRNVNLGSTRRMDAEATLQKAMAIKAEALEYTDGLP
jgi:hypothetical protein